LEFIGNAFRRFSKSILMYIWVDEEVSSLND